LQQRQIGVEDEQIATGDRRPGSLQFGVQSPALIDEPRPVPSGWPLIGNDDEASHSIMFGQHSHNVRE
jgi:hypothetical protein